jgi:hypothetical protein
MRDFGFQRAGWLSSDSLGKDKLLDRIAHFSVGHDLISGLRQLQTTQRSPLLRDPPIDPRQRGRSGEVGEVLCRGDLGG